MLALVTDVLTKTMTSPVCQPEIVPLRTPDRARSNVAVAAPKVTSKAVLPEATSSVGALDDSAAGDAADEGIVARDAAEEHLLGERRHDSETVNVLLAVFAPVGVDGPLAVSPASPLAQSSLYCSPSGSRFDPGMSTVAALKNASD
jgi:hypothetical protein